jgi:hypothetical protein
VNPTVQLGSVVAVFWLLGSIGLTGAVLGFLWPRTGLFESVMVGGLLVGFQVFLTWARLDLSRYELQFGLFNLMVWVSLCLLGAWVGTVLRQVAEVHLYQLVDEAVEEASTTAQDIDGEYSGAEAVPEPDATRMDVELRPSRLASEPEDGS